MGLISKEDLASVRVRKATIHESAKTTLIKAAESFSYKQEYDIFMSHSYLDAEEVLGLKQLIEDFGYSVYVDWIEDKQLDRAKVDKNTADTLRNRMCCCRSLFFATSKNSSNSKWMPWELGYFDARRGKVAILPIAETKSNSDRFIGQEYLGLYPYVAGGGVDLWIHESETKFVKYKDWVRLPNGLQPR